MIEAVSPLAHPVKKADIFGGVTFHTESSSEPQYKKGHGRVYKCYLKISHTHIYVNFDRIRSIILKNKSLQFLYITIAYRVSPFY